MGRALLQAVVGIMQLTQAQASSIIALTKSQSVSRESWAVGRYMHTEMTSERNGGQHSQHLLSDSPQPL